MATAMGAQTANGSWARSYPAQFTFSIGGKEFLYGQCQSDQYWFIQELLPGGKMGSVTDSGTWDYSYAV